MDTFVWFAKNLIAGMATGITVIFLVHILEGLYKTLLNMIREQKKQKD